VKSLNLFTSAKPLAFSTNHLAGTDKTEHNYNQEHKNLNTMQENK